MSVTSSASRRPFGKPWKSPASAPSVLGFAAGGIAVFSRSRSACTFPVKFSPGTPVSSTATRSSRSAVGVSGGAGYRKLTRPASSGLV